MVHRYVYVCNITSKPSNSGRQAGRIERCYARSHLRVLHRSHVIWKTSHTLAWPSVKTVQFLRIVQRNKYRWRTLILKGYARKLTSYYDLVSYSIVILSRSLYFSSIVSSSFSKLISHRSYVYRDSSRLDRHVWLSMTLNSQTWRKSSR